MKATLVLCVLLFATVDSKAQDIATNGSGPEKSAANSEARIQTLEQQVSMLAEQVALLRGQLKVLADAKAPGAWSAAHLVLTSAPAPASAGPSSAASAAGEPAAIPAPAAPAP